MKRFKQFLAEVVGLKDVSDIVFMHLNEYDRDDTSSLRQTLLPMSKKMSERIFGKRNRLTAAHITNEGAVDEIITTRRLIDITKTYAIFGDKMKSVVLCLNRFDDETRESFVDFYTKVDAGVSLEDLMKPEEEIIEESQDEEVPF